MPEKISFKYLTRTVEDLDVQIDRRKGERYIVSPYRLAITNGNYYLVRFCGPVFFACICTYYSDFAIMFQKV